MEKCFFDKVVIIGVGLIGGSLGLAGKEKSIFGEVVGVGRSRANLDQARERGAVDDFFQEPREALPGADLVVLATPVQSIVTIGKEIAPLLEDGAILTDVGSVKEGLVRELESNLPAGVRFVGGHPIAGSEASGASAAREDLFLHRRTILTPTGRTDPEALARVHAMWEAVGSIVVEMDVDAHDRILAAVSHLPQYGCLCPGRDLDGDDGGLPRYYRLCGRRFSGYDPHCGESSGDVAGHLQDE